MKIEWTQIWLDDEYRCRRDIYIGLREDGVVVWRDKAFEGPGRQGARLTCPECEHRHEPKAECGHLDGTKKCVCEN